MGKTALRREANIAKALGNPKRLEIIQLLGQRHLRMSEIQRMTGFPQANLSQHLRELKLGQIVVAERQGKNITFRLAHPNFLAMAKLLRETIAIRHPSRYERRQTEVQDPVCGMWIEPSATHFHTVYKGATIFFCASGCQSRFSRHPERYV